MVNHPPLDTPVDLIPTTFVYKTYALRYRVTDPTLKCIIELSPTESIYDLPDYRTIAAVDMHRQQDQIATRMQLADPAAHVGWDDPPQYGVIASKIILSRLPKPGELCIEVTYDATPGQPGATVNTRSFFTAQSKVLQAVYNKSTQHQPPSGIFDYGAMGVGGLGKKK